MGKLSTSMGAVRFHSPGRTTHCTNDTCSSTKPYRAALDLIFDDYFSRDEPGIFAPLRDALLTHGDYYMHRRT